MAEELIYKVGVEGTNELDKLEKSVDKAGKSVGKTKLYMSELRTELRKARGDMIKYAEGTEEYNRALARGSQITSQINDANSKMRIGVQDLGTTTKNVTGTMVGFAGGFQVVQSAMSLFGIENEETIKTVLKLQQTMAIVQGMARFAQGISDMQNLMAAFRASNHQLTDDLKTTGDGMEGVSKSTDKMGDSMKTTGKESAVLGSNLAGTSKVSADLKDGLSNLTKQYEGLNVEQLKVARATAVQTKLDLESGGVIMMGNQSVEESIALKKLEIEEIDRLIVRKKLEGEATKENISTYAKAKKGLSAFSKSILTSLGTMAVFLVAIAAVTYAISYLVKKMSEIPEKLKITIELDETALKNLVSDLEKARLFALKYNKAVKEGNEDLVKQLDKVGRKQFGLNDEQLKAIGTQRTAWKEAFKEYLQTAKDTYYNEALAKRKSEAQIDEEVARERIKASKKAIEDQDLYAGLFTVATGRIALDRELSKANKALKQAEKDIKVLDKIEYREVNYKADEVTTGGGGGDGGTVKSTKAPKFGLRKPDTVEEDLLTKQSEKIIKLREGFTNEEQAIMEEAQRKFDKRQDDSLIKYTEYQIKLGEAIAKDLKIKLEGKEKELLGMEILYDEELSIQNQALEEKTRIHNEELEYLRKLTQDKFDIEENANKLIEERASVDPKDSAKIKAIDAEIEALQRLYEANDADIAMSKDKISTAKEEIKSIEEKLQKLDLMPEQIKALGDEMDQLTLQIEENSARIVDAAAANMVAMMDMATTYVDSIGAAYKGIANMNADFMQAEDNKLAKEKNNLELKTEYQQASNEEQQQMMYELELANYEAKKKTFETNKNFEIGSVIAASAANQMDIIKAWLDPKTGGPLSPVNIAVAAAATIANMTTMVGSIAQIRSTSLDEPIPPSGAGGSGGPGASVALSPNKTSLTSKEENLNMMYKSGKSGEKDTIVKVSEINNVQNKVKVREKNSSY